jgi:hypothetical protein
MEEIHLELERIRSTLRGEQREPCWHHIRLWIQLCMMVELPTGFPVSELINPLTFFFLTVAYLIWIAT